MILLAACLLNSCHVDLMGFFGSNDLDTRLYNADELLYPDKSQQTLSLGDSYSFLVLADTHIEKKDALGLEKLKDVIAAEDKFVVICGDISQTGYKIELEKFIEVADSWGVPCFPVIGNHDVYSDNWNNWRDIIGATRYRIDSDTASLFVLDSANCYFGDEQLDWLDKELKSRKERVFVFTHADLFMEDTLQFQQFTDVRERARLISILKGRCDIMFMGHSHMGYEKKAGGIQFINLEDYVKGRAYCRVKVSPQGISLEYKKL